MTTQVTIKNENQEEFNNRNVEVAEFDETSQTFGTKSVLIPGESMQRTIWDGLVLFVKEVPN